MNSKRILAIASLVDKNDKLIDVGCDHGYLGIYLTKNNLVEDILLTDLRESALNNAKENIEKYNLNIKTLLTDGLNDIDLNLYNAISISGMGTKTILNILSKLKDNNSINKLIIQSNNDLEILRKEINNLGYFLEDEITVLENDIYYVICKFIKSDLKNDQATINYGIVKKDKINYYNYLINYYKDILSKVVNKDLIINELNNKINDLKELLEKCR